MIHVYYQAFVPAVFRAFGGVLLYGGFFCCCPTLDSREVSCGGVNAVDLAGGFLARARLSASERHEVQHASQQQATVAPHDFKLMWRKVISVVHASMLNYSTKNFTTPITD
jgi:hypothetical protein